MKKGLAYFLGILTGIAFTLLVVFILAKIGNNRGITYYDQPGDSLPIRTVTVCQSHPNGSALVSESGYARYEDQLYLLVTEDKKAFYDGETVKAPTGMVFRVVGVYSYTMSDGLSHTVPVIALMSRK